MSNCPLRIVSLPASVPASVALFEPSFLLLPLITATSAIITTISAITITAMTAFLPVFFFSLIGILLKSVSHVIYMYNALPRQKTRSQSTIPVYNITYQIKLQRVKISLSLQTPEEYVSLVLLSPLHFSLFQYYQPHVSQSDICRCLDIRSSLPE